MKQKIECECYEKSEAVALMKWFRNHEIESQPVCKKCKRLYELGIVKPLGHFNGRSEPWFIQLQ